MDSFVYIYIHTWTHVCTYIYVYIHCICVCIYMGILGFQTLNPKPKNMYIHIYI